MTRSLAVLALLLGSLAACSGDDDSSADTTTSEETTTTGAAKPADEALADAGRDSDGHPIKEGEVGGEPVVIPVNETDDTGELVVITEIALSVMSVGAPYVREGGERVADIEVRAENVGDKETSSPDFLLRCGDEDQAFYEGSTYDNGSPLPANSFAAGKIISEFPEGCESPTVVTEFSVTYDTDPVAHWPL